MSSAAAATGGAAASTAVTAAASSPPPSSSSFFFQNISSLGLGYAIAVALGVLVLLSAVLLASYVCCRASSRRRNPNPNGANDPGVLRPRIIFVAEEDGSGSEDGGGVAATGLDPAAIASYPRFPFSAAKGGGGADAVCSICLGEYKEGELMRMMPDCRHYFHLPCIDAWLRLNASCPVCRTSPMPTPLSTPLSELVPLSHYAADRRRRG